MKTHLFPALRKWSASLAVAMSAVSCTCTAQSYTDSFSDGGAHFYNQVGRQFSLLIQNAHFSHKPFTKEESDRFLDSYLKEVDPAHLYLTQKDVNELRNAYGPLIGEALLTGRTTTLAQKLYDYFSQKALARIARAEKVIAAYQETDDLGKVKEAKTKTLDFDSDETMPRSRRKVAWEKDDAALDRVWDCLSKEYLLSEELRRENLSNLAKEQGKPNPMANDLSPVAKLAARYKRMKHSIMEVDLQDMVTRLLSAVAKVYDPHTDYMGEREEERFKNMMVNSLIGIGALLEAQDDGTTKINGIVKGGPAEKGGELKLGDKIIAVDTDNSGHFVDILFMGIDKVVDLVRGKEGVTVGLRVVPEANPSEVKIVKILRQKVEMKDEFASAKIIDMQTDEKKTYRLGVLTLPSFYVDLDGGDDVRCAADVKKILQRMILEKVDGLIVDLRGNGGGSLEEVRRMVGFFTGAGPVVQVRDFRGNVEALRVGGKPLFTGPLVVMCNKLSASASEIFAGAMADYGRAVIVGDATTFGKGTVQMPVDIGDYLPYSCPKDKAGMLKVTTQKFYRVSGKSTQFKGVESDIVLPTSTACFEIGENILDNALPYDEISPSYRYTQLSQWKEMIPELRKRSRARVEKDKDMQYMQEDILRFRERLAKNSISLNRKVRQKENSELLQRKKNADSERKKRYAAMEKEDKRKLTIYRLSLNDVTAGKLPLATPEDEDSFMNMAEDPDEKLAASPDYPSKLDPELREGLHILKDMIDLSAPTSR